MLTPRDSTAAPNTQLDPAHGVPCMGGGSSSCPVCHLPLLKPTEDVTETRAEVKRQGETESALVSECCKWPWDISCKCWGAWLYSQARTHSDAFLSHEILFLKCHSCTLRLHRINKICGSRSICVYRRRWALSGFWIISGCPWLLLSASELSCNKPLESIFYSSVMTPQTLHTSRHISL